MKMKAAGSSSGIMSQRSFGFEMLSGLFGYGKSARTPKEGALLEGENEALDGSEVVDVDGTGNGSINSTKEKAPAAGFGGKHIGHFSSLCLLVNNITGPGMVQIPNIYQSAGWLFPTIVFVGVGVLIGFVGMYLSKAVASMPGNAALGKRVEFNELAKAIFPRWLYILTMCILILNFQATNISSIIVSAQTMDNTMLAMAKTTCAIYLYPLKTPACIRDSDVGAVVTDSPFGDDYVISLGYAITMAFTLPLGYINLEDNMWVQQGGFLLLCVCLIVWYAQFAISGLRLNAMPVNDFSGWGPVLSTVLFNSVYVATLPSWLNEKKKGVSVARTGWSSVIISGIMFLLLGILGGFSTLDFNNGANLLAVMNDPHNPTIMLASRVMVYIFPIAALLSGIPIFCIIIRYNLINEGVPYIWANLFAVVFPWGVALFFFAGDLLATLITWSSAIVFVLLNFVLPLAMYIGINDVPFLPSGCLRKKFAAEAAEVDNTAEKLQLISGGSGGAGKTATTTTTVSAVGTATAAAPTTSSSFSVKGSTPAAVADALAYRQQDALLALQHQATLNLQEGGGGYGSVLGDLSDAIDATATDNEPPEEINEIPCGLGRGRCCDGPRTLVVVLLWISIVLAFITFGLQIYSATQ